MKKEENLWDDIHKKLKQDVLKHSPYAEKCESLFPRNSLICDLGGGLGFDALYFLKKGHKVVILDISKYALNHAKELAKRQNFEDKLLVKQADFGLGKFPLKDESFDVVYSRIGLNYFPFRETQVLISEAKRVLRPGGSCYILLKSPDDAEEMKFLTKNAVEMEKGTYIEGGQIRSRFTAEQLEEMLKEIGIKQFSVKAYQEGVYSQESELGSLAKTLFLNEINFKKSVESYNKEEQ